MKLTLRARLAAAYPDALLLVGTVLALYGVDAIYRPAAFILGGAALIAVGRALDKGTP